MKSFEWVQPATLAEAIEALKHPGSMPLAGGVDLLDRMKERITTPTRLVSLRKLPLFGHVDISATEARIGARITLAEIAHDAAPWVSRTPPMLRAMRTGPPVVASRYGEVMAGEAIFP